MVVSEGLSNAMLTKLKTRARALKQETLAVYVAAQDPRTPWYVKALIFFVVAHTFSPIDLIPDVIPVLGYLDDLIITPGGLWLAIRLIPPDIMAQARVTVATPPWSERIEKLDRTLGTIGAGIVILAWIAIVASVVYLIVSG
jgi:uncharacterized membrane protein YkvA (DUF1232 family)